MYVKPCPKNRHKLWIYGEVVGKPAPISCSVSTPFGTIFHKHAQVKEGFHEPSTRICQLIEVETMSLHGKDDTNTPTDEANPDSLTIAGEMQEEPSALEHDSPLKLTVEQPSSLERDSPLKPTVQQDFVLRILTRNRKLPSKFKDHVMNILSLKNLA